MAHKWGNWLYNPFPVETSTFLRTTRSETTTLAAIFCASSLALTEALHLPALAVEARGGGGRDNGPYADSFPLWCHFHGGGGGCDLLKKQTNARRGGGGGGRGLARGGGGAPGPYIYGVKWPPHHANHFEVPMWEQKILQQGGGGMVGGTFV